MEPLAQFAAEKHAVLQTLEGLGGLLEEIRALGVDTGEDAGKIAHARQAIESDALRIALLGAFSDGKTSVVAAWLGRVLDDMKIDMDESSDRLATYVPSGLPDRCEIVDTPGLFGDKALGTEGRRVMYEDLTKRYISEAHLILYVVDATNPLKDSHADVVKWVLRDLGKLDATLFVINKMDEVSDLRDPVSFDEQARIKRRNLQEKLQRAADLGDDERDRLRIVCVAANPNGRGLPFWFGRMADYEARSRIPGLKAATLAVLRDSVPAVLQAKTGMDVVRDVVAGRIAALEQQQQVFAEGKAATEQEIERVGEDLEKGRRDIRRHARSLGDELDALDRELMGKLRPLELDELRPFLEDEIGLVADEVGMKLQRRIKSIVDKYAEQSAEVANRVAKDIARQLGHTSRLLESLGGQAAGMAALGLKGLQGMKGETIKSAILAARGWLREIGIVIKFKPHGVDKLAGGIAKWAGPASAALELGGDIYQHIRQAERESTLAKTKLSIASEVQKATQEVRRHLLDDAATFAFLSPQLAEFAQVLAGLREALAKLDAGKEAVDSLRARLDALSPGQGPAA